MADRSAQLQRETTETRIEIRLDLDGKGETDIDTGIGFFDHMLTALGKHALLNLHVRAIGDRHVDLHHTVEDVGIVLGQALDQALGDRAGIARYASMHLPMDEALVRAALDVSGRPYLVFGYQPHPGECVGEFPMELLEEFFRALAHQARITLHLDLIHGRNVHHIAECFFKSFARVLDAATQKDPRVRGIPSTKDVL